MTSNTDNLAPQTAADTDVPPYSLVIIAQDAAAHIEKCIRSVPNANEVLLVDSGSKDGTQEIAQSLGAKVIHQDWLGFGPQKQFATAQAKNDWILSLDADESLSPELQRDIPKQLQAGQHQCYQLARCNQFMGKELRHGGGYPDWNLRLFNRNAAQWTDDLVHEHIKFEGDLGSLNGDLLHDSAIELTSYLTKQNVYTNIQAQQLFERGKKIGFAKLILSPSTRFIKEYFLRRGFLDGIPGLVHISVACFFSFIKYAKTIELQRRNSTSP